MNLEVYRYFSKPPILIGGCGRSGTSLLLSILSAHPKIVGIPVETTVFTQSRYFSMGILNRLNHYRKLMPFFGSIEKKKTAHRWCEKTPRNIRWFRIINDEFMGRIKFIHIVRDGRDVVTSSHPYYGKNYVSISRWVGDVSVGLEAASLSNLYVVKYEELVTNYEHTIKGILDFLDEDYIAEMLDFYKYTGVKEHLAYKENQVQQITNSSIGKWKRPEHKDIIEDFYKNEKAVTLLQKLGYIK